MLLTNLSIKPKKKKTNWFKLSKPKQVAKGGHGIRQYYKIDETKLSAKKRLGRNIQPNDYTI